MTFFKKTKEKPSLEYILKLTATVVLAFLTALFFRRSAGVLATFPIAFALCGLAAFVKLDIKLKLTIFGIMVFSLNTAETEDLKVTLTFVALCLLACTLFQWAVKLIRQRKKIAIPFFSASAVICIVLSAIFIGNPISAIKANKLLTNYTEEKYLSSQQGESEYNFSEIYYNFNTKAFEIRAESNKFPTEPALISTKNDLVYDSFESVVQQQLSTPYILEITRVLREQFPEDNFSVSLDEIQMQNQKEVVSAADGELYGKIAFEIYIGGVQTTNDMRSKVAQYASFLDHANVDYARITFKSGINPWVRQSVTITKNRPLGDYDFTITRVPAFSSNRFNRFAKAPSLRLQIM